MNAEVQSPVQPKISLMLVANHEGLRNECRRHFARANTMQIVAEAGSGEEACEKFPTYQPQVVVTDIDLPGMGGLASIRRIVTKNHHAKIAVFSRFKSLVFVVRALDAGAMGFTYQSSGFALLDAAIAQLARGERFLEPEIARQLALRSWNWRQEECLSSLESLTAREFEVFVLLARGATLAETADKLYLGYNTVANRSRSIRHKLRLASNGEIGAFAQRCRLFSD